MNQDLIIKKRAKLVRKAFPESFLDRDGVNVSIHCVNKKCKTFNNPLKKKLCLRVDSEIYHCWVCGMRGKGLVRFFRLYKPNHHDAAKEAFSDEFRPKEDEETIAPIELPPGFQLLGTIDNRSDPDLKACLNYVKKRNLTDHDLWHFRLGATSEGSYRRRVIIPSFDNDGNLTFFTARSIDKGSYRKYMNPRYQRGSTIFNEFHIDWKSLLTIVEGPFDVFSANTNCTALLGSTLSVKDELFQRIVKNKTPVILALDSDAIKKRDEIAALLVSYDIDVYYIRLGEFSDVGEMSKDQFKKTLTSKIKWRKSDKLMNLINSIKSGSLI